MKPNFHRLIVIFSIVCILLTLFIESFRSKSLKIKSQRDQTTDVPKIIWTYWHDPLNIPPIVQNCLNSWRENNPDFSIVILNVDNIRKWCGVDLNRIPNLDTNNHARTSDFCRLFALAKFGGIWMDASIICTKPLDWVIDIQKTHESDLVTYEAPFTTNRNYPIPENWFLVAPSNSSFIKDWVDEGMNMLTNFKSEKDYVDHIKNATSIDMQKLPDMLPYLVMHLCATVVMQRKRRDYNIYFLDAMSGPFKYLNDNSWDHERAFNALCSKPELWISPLIKLRGDERQWLETNHRKVVCEATVVPKLIYNVIKAGI